MKKIILMLALVSAVMCANAQIATENSNAFDNIGIGITGGVSTPLDFNSVFPLNVNAGLKVTKDITPVIGLQLEGLAFLNDNHFTDLKTAVKATNVGLNGTINLSNFFYGYKGVPRTFEVSTATGIGWLHMWDTKENSLSAKTGLDFAFNLGKKKAHSLVLTPAVYWDLHKFTAIRFNKHNAQLALNLSYIYHFKNSNGTHYFKTWDIGALNAEINYLKGALDECNNREPKVVEVEKVVEKTITVPTDNQWVVEFAQGSAELTDYAKMILNSIGDNLVVDVVGTSSIEGNAAMNQKLSEQRAVAVMKYLTNKGVRVNNWEGQGVRLGESTNRLAIITIVK